MTQKIINIGKLPNDGTGDPLRKAFAKTNDNFDELYEEFTPVKQLIAGKNIVLNPTNGIGTVTIYAYDQCDMEIVVDGDGAIELPIGNLVVDGGRAFVCTDPQIQEMELTFDTTLSVTDEIELPLYGTVDVIIDWGDGEYEHVTSAGNVNHIYDDSGTYFVKISGQLTDFGDATGGVINPESLISVSTWGTIGLTSLAGAFYNCSNLVSVPSSLPTTVTNLSNCFYGASSFNQNIALWNTINVDYMNGIFEGATIFNQNIGSWNTQNAINMSSMFKNAIAFNQDIGSWDTSSAVNMDEMFLNASNFDQDLSGWCVTLISTLPTDFATGSDLAPGNYPVWGTCPS